MSRSDVPSFPSSVSHGLIHPDVSAPRSVTPLMGGSAPSSAVRNPRSILSHRLKSTPSAAARRSGSPSQADTPLMGGSPPTSTHQHSRQFNVSFPPSTSTSTSTSSPSSASLPHPPSQSTPSPPRRPVSYVTRFGSDLPQRPSSVDVSLNPRRHSTPIRLPSTHSEQPSSTRGGLAFRTPAKGSPRAPRYVKAESAMRSAAQRHSYSPPPPCTSTFFLHHISHSLFFIC